MTLAMHAVDPPCGEYVRILFEDTEQARNDGRQIMRAQGCKAVRFVTLTNGSLQVHGYLRPNDFAEAL